MTKKVDAHTLELNVVEIFITGLCETIAPDAGRD